MAQASHMEELIKKDKASLRGGGRSTRSGTSGAAAGGSDVDMA